MNILIRTSALILFSSWALFACARADEVKPSASVSSAQDEPGATTWRVASPDQSLTFTIAENGDGPLQYRVDIDGETQIIDWSDLGVKVARGSSSDGPDPVIADFGETVTVVSDEAGQFSQTYEMKTGKQLINTIEANTLSLEIKDDETGRLLTLDIRVQNGGFGFRYRLAEEDILFSVLESENTTFALDPKGRFWGQPYDFATEWQPAYETRFEDGIRVGSPVGSGGTGWGFPSLIETPDGAWLLLHETGLSKSFHGSHLEPDAPGGVYKTALPLKESAWGYGKQKSAAKPPWVMPWRIGIVGRKAGDIFESNLAFDFAEPSQIKDTSWIKPGVASWSWLSDHASSRDLDKLKTFIDLSAEMTWPYSLVDANWNTISETSMQDLSDYGATKNVGLFFWYNSGGRHNTVTEQPRNIMSDPALRRAEFAKLQRLGIKGVKVDFFHSDKQDMIALYLDILKDAADHSILVNFHGCTIPRGWQRTWPNLVTMESVLGGEVYTFPSNHNYGEIAPKHNTILPFTRNVIGSMDYTPVIYSDQLIPRLTSNGHETALAVLFESGVQHIGDSAASLRQLPEHYKSFFKTLPTVWEETRYLAGGPGDYVVVARRSGQQWYVAGINGTPKAKTLTLDLSFIKGNGDRLILLHDDETGLGFPSSIIQPGDLETMEVEMNAYGGFVLVQ